MHEEGVSVSEIAIERSVFLNGVVNVLQIPRFNPLSQRQKADTANVLNLPQKAVNLLHVTVWHKYSNRSLSIMQPCLQIDVPANSDLSESNKSPAGVKQPNSGNLFRVVIASPCHRLVSFSRPASISKIKPAHATQSPHFHVRSPASSEVLQ
jgi:hypothetical protein